MSLDPADINTALMKLILILWIRKLKENLSPREELIKASSITPNRKFLALAL